MTPILKKVRPTWDMAQLRTHLQGAADLEFWTIPYYMSVMYSIKDRTSETFQLIQAVTYQEMLHAQLVSNIANAFGYSPTFAAPVYEGQAVPHIDFNLDEPNPTERFQPYSAELGPLDEARLNTMCLIEYPEWETERKPDLRGDVASYGSIGEFYDALRAGITDLRGHIRGNVKQVDEFGPFYQNLPAAAITLDGDAGFHQAMTLIDVIVDQGEGQTQGDVDVPVEFQNTADGMKDSWPHFRKFLYIRNAPRRPETFSGVAVPAPGSPGAKAQQTLVTDFAAFTATLDDLFSGGRPPAFGAQMAKIGGGILTCWQHNAIPRFS